MNQNQRPEDIAFINEVFLHPNTQKVKDMTISRLVKEIFIPIDYVDDLVQDSYIASVEIITSFFNGTRRHMISEDWQRYYNVSLYKRLKHRYLLGYMEYRYERRTPHSKGKYILKASLIPLETLINWDNGQTFERTLGAWEAFEFVQQQNSIHAKVLIMKYDDYSEAEIAAKLDISLDSVKNYTRRGRAAARKWRNDQAEVS